ncbi:beta-N-acetylhexosaminidase [Kibdelosporangium aridum]|uniref:beta-N-acetylhexosaminidase n=1 Tax=Kibdelosporangium aridum TaxID=2030 RepID=A0A428ZKH8_KIBAR|nr:beta-N-acetylhexosaminidase [Kibdelosporangium aridum]RSM88458.1 beta-N-acetylhexosaminidase [Kibdelosporangium aridum]
MTSRITCVVPAPVEVHPSTDSFRITAATRVRITDDTAAVGHYLAETLGLATGSTGEITLSLQDKGPAGGYQLTVTNTAIALRANTETGLFMAVQTLRQLVSDDGVVDGGEIVDHPRFAHRGAMLDVSRHFFAVDEVKRFIDQIVQYKINVLHLHLTDDQGWRLEITSWPKLTTVGGATQVGGGPGGFYTQQEFRDLVAYAKSRHITLIPEIDIPGHVNAALVAYPELTCDGVAPPPFTTTGTATGFSSLCTDKEITYQFTDDVLREVAALTPGPYLHIGTDETHATPEEGYVKFVRRTLDMVHRYGKQAIGWHEILHADPSPGTIPQFWSKADDDPRIAEAAARGHKILLSPANKVYLDMKYTPDSPIGYKWAGYLDVRDVYDWDPGTYLHGVPEEAVIGVEGPLWTEHVEHRGHVDFMTFPRLPAIAELGWSPRETHDWQDFRRRLATHGPRWTAQGIEFYRSTQIPWAV